MVTKEEMEPYLDREHALVKHKLFECYLKRFVMILGRTHERLSYVDAFAGPWKSVCADYTDTSFGRAVNAIEGCSVTLAKETGRRPRFRSLLIEAKVSAFSDLSKYARSVNKSTSIVEAKNLRLQDSVKEISEWIDPKEKTFILIDPKAYKGLISPKVLAPLLKNYNVELLINYMWHFITLAIGRTKFNQKHEENMVDLFGEGYHKFTNLPPVQKEIALVREYAKRLREEANITGDNRVRVGMFPVEYAFRNGTKYYMVYVTHNPRGLIAFSEESEKCLNEQRQIKYITGQKRRECRTAVEDMFLEAIPEKWGPGEVLQSPWLKVLPNIGSEVVVDQNFWSNLIEDCAYLPKQLQNDLGSLVKNGVLEVVGATNKRRSIFVRWKDSEVVRRLM